MYNFVPNTFVVPIKFNKNRHLGLFTNFTSLTLAYENIYKMSVRIPVMTTTLAIKFSSWYHKTRYNYVCYCDMCLVWSCYCTAFYNSCERFSCICRINEWMSQRMMRRWCSQFCFSLTRVLTSLIILSTMGANKSKASKSRDDSTTSSSADPAAAAAAAAVGASTAGYISTQILMSFIIIWPSIPQ